MRASGSIRMRGFCHRFNNLETKLQYAIVTLNAQSSRHLRSSETHLHEIIKKIVFFVPSFSSFLHCTQVRQFSLRPRNWVSKCRNLWRLGRTTSHATRCCLGSRGVITSVFKPCETISVSRSTAEPIATTGHGRFREGDSTSHRLPGPGANNFRFLQLSSRAVDQSPVRKHCETAKAECGCEEITAGNSTQLHLIAPGAMSSRQATAGDGLTA